MANFTYTTVVYIGHNRLISCISGTYVLIRSLKKLIEQDFFVKFLTALVMVVGMSSAALAAVSPVERMEGLVILSSTTGRLARSLLGVHLSNPDSLTPWF